METRETDAICNYFKRPNKIRKYAEAREGIFTAFARFHLMKAIRLKGES